MATRKQKQRRHLLEQASQKQELNPLIADQVHLAVREILPTIISSIKFSHEEETIHIGPLPPPDDAKKYEELCPGFVDRTLGLTEKIQESDASLRARAQLFAFIHSIFGMLSALGIVVVTLYWTYVMFQGDHTWLESISPFLAGITTIASIFYLAKRSPSPPNAAEDNSDEKLPAKLRD